MLVPLDQLYNFLDSVSEHDLVIYRWFPHGSKKLTDLNENKIYSDLYIIITPQVIFHDQEPLNYDFYTPEVVFESIRERIGPIGKMYTAEFDEYLKKISANNICASLPGYNLYDKVLLVHSEKNSKDLQKYQLTNCVPVYYWSHAIIARDWYRYAKIDPALKNRDFNFDFDFLIYNRSWSGTREYRLKFSEIMVETGLFKDCLMNFNTVDDGVHYQDHKFSNSSLSIKTNKLEKYFRSNTACSNSSADYNVNDYLRCGIEIVLETLFDDNRLHLTEKILRPIACGVPFILAGTPGSLEYLRDYGFQTFGSFINEDYDQINDPVERLSAIAEVMQEIKNYSSEKKQQLYQDLKLICDHNRAWFFSDEFFKLVIKEYKENLNNGVHQLKIQHESIEQELFFKKIFFGNRCQFKNTNQDSDF